jgi:hypothetical protein
MGGAGPSGETIELLYLTKTVGFKVDQFSGVLHTGTQLIQEESHATDD